MNKICVSLIILITSLSGCKLDSNDISALVTKLPDNNFDRPDDRETISKSVQRHVQIGNLYYDYREETSSYEKLFDDQSLLNADYSKIYPGSLITENSVLQNNIAQSELSTNPMRVGINISYSDSVFVDSVDCNSPAAVNKAMNKILTKNPTGYHTNFYSKCAITNSYEEAMFKLNLNAKWFSGSLRAEFQNQDSMSSQNIYFLLKDEYYQAFCENPNADKLFANRLTRKDKVFFDTANQPLIIRSVSYGRVILVKSSVSNQFLRTTVSANIEQKFGTVSANATVFLSNMRRYGITNIEVMAYGGYKDINTGKQQTLDYLDSLITKGNTPSATSPGNPISYRVETLKHKPYSVRSVVTDYVRSHWENIPSAEIQIRFKDIRTLTPNILSSSVIGSFISNGQIIENGPLLPNNISFRDFHSPLNLNAGPVNFAALNDIFIRVPLNERGRINISLEMTLLPDQEGHGNGPDIYAGGVKSFDVLELLSRNQNVIQESITAQGATGGLECKCLANFEIIMDPKKEFEKVYGSALSAFIIHK